MERIINRDIFITFHKVDGFSLSYITDNNQYFRKRYIGYGLKQAVKLFKKYIKNELTALEVVI